MSDETMTVEEKTDAAHMKAAFDETGLNGTAINWRYWVEQMPTLSAAQAACLMSALDPDKFVTWSERPGRKDPSRNIEKARAIQRLAESQGRLTASPKEWLEWAQGRRFNVHTGFLLAVWELPEQPPIPADSGSEYDAEAVGGEGTASGKRESEAAIPAAMPPYITTTELVACFGGYMGVQDPNKVISGYPNWATKNRACITRGKAGAVSANNPNVSQWDPVQFALNLLAKRPIPQLSGKGKLRQQDLDTVFSMRSLDAWKPRWVKSKPL